MTYAHDKPEEQRLRSKAQDDKWRKRYDQLVQFKADNGHLRIHSRMDQSFYNWVVTQMSLYLQKKLFTDRKELLDQLDFSRCLKSWIGKQQKHFETKKVMMSDAALEYAIFHDENNIKGRRLADPTLQPSPTPPPSPPPSPTPPPAKRQKSSLHLVATMLSSKTAAVHEETAAQDDALTELKNTLDAMKMLECHSHQPPNALIEFIQTNGEALAYFVSLAKNLLHDVQKWKYRA
jgi:hypothetical protein